VAYLIESNDERDPATEIVSIVRRVIIMAPLQRGSLQPAALRRVTASGAGGRLAERRSANRPKFVASWHKTIANEPAEAEASRQSDHIDVWLGNPDSLLRAHSSLKLLTPEDWATFDRVADSSMRQAAMAARILLRLGLSKAADHRIAPAEWKFKTLAFGKPAVADDLPPMKFSVSHTDRLAAVAISPNLDIGIDVEGVDQNVGEGVLAGFSHPQEKLELSDLLPRQKAREFIRLWTFKEALAKMIGTGLSLDFNTTRFMLDPVQLASVNKTEKLPPSAHFESIYVSVEHFLYHVSLAIDYPQDHQLPTEVRIITLAEPKAADVASRAPALY
jgi:4'-phosphopantetheinyl transferase